MINTLKDARVTLILATHSTALLAGLAEIEDVHVAFMKRKQTDLVFKKITDIDRTILPMFGAHPLSNVFNQAPIFLVEGEDDERIWQQAIRSSRGKISVFPCVINGNRNFLEFETEVNNIISSIYDNARGFSLRDRDDQREFIDDIGHIIRMRLNCRAAENLMLSDNVLSFFNTTWPTMKRRLDFWLKQNPSHYYYDYMRKFADDEYDRRNHDLKEIRNILANEISNKPWEVLVGKTIAKLASNPSARDPYSLGDFLGEKVCTYILKLPTALNVGTYHPLPNRD